MNTTILIVGVTILIVICLFALFTLKKKKELYKEVIPKLKTNNVTKCNLPFGTLKVIKSKRKINPTKTSMKEKYISFYNSMVIFEKENYNEKYSLVSEKNEKN